VLLEQIDNTYYPHYATRILLYLISVVCYKI